MGYGQYSQALPLNVDAGDLIAKKLTNTTSNQVFWGFAGGNETAADAKVGHLWNYDLNTWGWEDSSGGSDNDYNDLVVQFDFASTAATDGLSNVRWRATVTGELTNRTNPCRPWSSLPPPYAARQSQAS